MSDPIITYRWVAEARAKPHKHPRLLRETRDQARQARDWLNDAKTVPYVARRLNPAILASASESAWLYPEGSLT